MSSLVQKVKNFAESKPTDDALISYKALRKAIGWIGILLPTVLIIWGRFFADCKAIQPSVSHYYYTVEREMFTGAMCAAAFFLICYKGFSKLDSWLSNLAAVFALIVVLFPTYMTHDGKGGYPCQVKLNSLFDVPWHGTIHIIAAGLFLLTLAFISFYLFTLSSEDDPALLPPAKRKRNLVYRLCGIVMVLCVIVIGIYFASGKEEEDSYVTIIGETIAMLAFGFSWLTKGEALFPDPKN